ncbi:amidohydrolase family protein [Paraburkholderia sp. 40]|uniref:amidohydrolase family protein n=1 Tax=Paraburkholderia sp. 40 TaxID=2991059 RepID=UPI003D245E15
MTHGAFQHNPIRPQWLAARTEEPLDPALPVVDSHHHLYQRPGLKYLFDDMLADLRCGHDVRATVYVQARTMYRVDAPPAMRPVGETEFANGVAAKSASGLYGDVRMCAAIVGFADLLLGDDVRPVLERHIAAAGGPVSEGGRFRGIRQSLAWDGDSALFNAAAYATTEDMMDCASFRAGFAHLGALGLSFDAWLLFPQIPRLTSLARAFPETPIVLNHCGGVLGIERFTGKQQEVLAQWKASLLELAKCPNVMVKLSGLGMRLSGFRFEDRDRAPSSADLADAWRPWFETCIEAFGADRCMYGSNFPVDKGSYSFGVGLNGLKRIAAGASAEERADLFWRSATRFYRLRSDIASS